MGKRFPEYENPTIAAGIFLPIEGEVAYIHSTAYPSSLGFRPPPKMPLIIVPKKGKESNKETLDFGDIL